MTGSPGVVDFFAIEANEYLDQLDALLAGGGGAPPAAEPFVRTARALRGASTMARRAALADLAGAIESLGAAVRDGRQPWSPVVSDALVAAVDSFRVLIRNVKDWSPADDARAAARADELRGLATADPSAARSAPVVPISSLFHDDDGPHVVHRNHRPPISADLRFRQAAVPLASTLRRLIGESRHATDDASRRTAGDDLRAALRDLGELAATYDIRPVVNFARAREASLAALEERTLEIVDGAAQALVESAGAVWARPTPTAPTGVIAPPPPLAAPAPPAAEPSRASSASETAAARTVEPAAPDPAEPEPAEPEPAAPASAPRPGAGGASGADRDAPPSGQALVALLQTSITGLHQLTTETPLAVPAPPAPADAPADGIVAIDSLVYRGRAALDRARQVRDTLRATPAPDPELLAELYELLDLAAADEPARA